MIIRAPIRTKTKSFRGDQMDFKFPSNESLPRGTLEEYHLNNHHLLNDVFAAENGVSRDEDGNSQILSDYTSTSNTNTNSGYSSNGYYSFANISDNTTSSPLIVINQNETARLTSSDSNKSDFFASHDFPGNDSLHYSSSSVVKNQLHSMEAIPEGNITGSISTAFQTIPTADNVSYDIAPSSASSLLPRKSTSKSAILPSTQEAKPMTKLNMEKDIKTIELNNSVVPKPKKKLNRVPTIRRVESSRFSNSRYSSSVSSKSSSSRCSLKRSKAIRCKGGLLYYFTSLGIKIKKKLRKLRLVLRRRLFSYNVQKVPSATNSKTTKSKANINNKSKKRGTNLVNSNSNSTPRQKKSQRYVSNLQRSISSKSLVPVLAPQKKTKPLTVDTKFKANHPQSEDSKVGSNTPRSPLVSYTPSLRRTNSSIRRAASILTASATMTPANNKNSFISVPDNVSHAVTRNSSMYSRSRLVRSKPSTALNAIARQPSIVVENKVIPLSMNRYSIKEEDEYVIDTSSMRELSPVNSVCSSDYDRESSESYSNYADAMETTEVDNKDRVECNNEIQNVNANNEETSNEESYNLMKHYLSTVIAQRIMLRVQIARIVLTSRRFQSSFTFLNNQSLLSKNQMKSKRKKGSKKAAYHRQPPEHEHTAPLIKQNKTITKKEHSDVRGSHLKKKRSDFSWLPRVPSTSHLKQSDMTTNVLYSGYRPLFINPNDPKLKEDTGSTLYEFAMKLEDLNEPLSPWISSATGLEFFSEWENIPSELLKNLKPFHPPKEKSMNTNELIHVSAKRNTLVDNKTSETLQRKMDEFSKRRGKGRKKSVVTLLQMKKKLEG
ncbi:ASB_HP2_G0054010.mRNA.1.CDS.1 [Saccharomyces cerevisiae]|nr:ASB_HP2_G0054010.mRNA.1.CDS.1 [Saccharomyces cerevisiae]CAI6816334.1 ASB_HP2_G0054010.mRNA.1.CDS.1 [Saccharomyces cerevisiae]